MRKLALVYCFHYFADMINMLKLDFTPSTGEWIHPVSDPQHTIAVADIESPKIYIFDGHGTNTPLHVLDSIHTKPVSIIKVHYIYAVVMPYDRYYCEGVEVAEIVIYIEI